LWRVFYQNSARRVKQGDRIYIQPQVRCIASIEAVDFRFEEDAEAVEDGVPA